VSAARALLLWALVALPSEAAGIEKFRVEPRERAGAVFVTISGVDAKIGEGALKAWGLLEGSILAYSGADGAGGHENTGQSLRVYNAADRTTRLVVSEYFPIKDVTAAKLKNGAAVLVVQLEDDMSDAPHVAVVDPKRGTVWRKEFASVSGCKGGTLTITTYARKDWDEHHDNPGHVVRPRGKERVDLADMLTRSVIKLEPMR
jgi:hypothetical protein